MRIWRTVLNSIVHVIRIHTQSSNDFTVKTFCKIISDRTLNMLSRPLNTSMELYIVSKMSNELQLDLYLACGFKKLSYEERPRGAGLTTLEVRRQRGDLIKCYKLLTGKENIDPHQFFRLSDNVHGLCGHSLKLFLDRCHPDLRKYFFSQSVISVWNSLPQHVVNATSVNSACSLEDHWIWTIKAQPTEVHNNVITSTRLQVSTSRPLTKITLHITQDIKTESAVFVRMEVFSSLDNL